MRLWMLCLFSTTCGCLLLAEPPELSDDGIFSDGGEEGGGDPAPETGWVDVSVGYSTLCALHQDGSLWCGRDGTVQRIDDSIYLSVSDSAWGDGACAVRSDGVLRCGVDGSFGDDFELPGPFEEVSGSGGAGCGLLGSGGARCWPEATMVTGPFSSVGAGDRFACGIIDGSGALDCWSIDDLIFDEPLTDIPSGSYEQVVTDSSVGCARRSDGDVLCWGGYDSYDRGWGPAAGNYVDVSMGPRDGCAVRTDGSVTCWGESAGDPAEPAGMIPSGESFAKIELGEDLGCGVTKDGRLVCW